MHLNKDYEPEIAMKDLFFHVVFRWRSIIAVALVAAALMGGYKYLSMKKKTNSTSSELQTQQDIQLSKEELELNQNIAGKEKQIEELEAYLNESVYIQMNPQGIWTASCEYLIKKESAASESTSIQLSLIDPVDSILPAYLYPLSDASIEELQQTFNTDKQEYVNELVVTEINTEENTVTVSVKSYTKETALKGLEYVKTRIKAITEKAQNLGEHSLMNIGESILFGTDVISTTDALTGRKAALTSALTQYKQELQALQDKADALKSGGISAVSKKDIFKFALIGFLAGAFLMICFYAIHYVINGKLMNGNSLSEQYDLPLFGELQKSSTIHNNKGLDKLLSKWELGDKSINNDKIYENISALIAEQEKAVSILLVSTLNKEKLDPLKETLQAHLEDKIIDAEGSFLNNSNGISEAAKAGSVILAEERNVSRNKEIERMAEMLVISKANVIGVIVL